MHSGRCRKALYNEEILEMIPAAYMSEEERVVENSLDCVQGIRPLIMISKIDSLTSQA